MNSWTLPTSLSIGGVVLDIETDYRTIIDVLIAFNNPEYDAEEKRLYCLISIIKDFDSLPESLYNEAMEKISEFIDMGISSDGKPKPRTMDWEQDAPLIIPEINKQIGNGVDVRSFPSMHWWTFLGYYMGIGECTFSHIVNIRHKQATHEKLDKWEKDFVRENRSLVELNKITTVEDVEDMNALADLLG